MSAPQVRMNSYPIIVGRTGSYNTIYGNSYEGLLASSSNHRTKGGGWSGGGPFYCCKRYIRQPYAVPWRQTEAGTDVDYLIGGSSQPPQLRWTSPPLFDSWPSVQAELATWYATGWARTRPGQPEASVGQFLIELRDLPQVPFSRAGKAYSGLLHRTGGNIRDVGRIMRRELLDFRNLGSEYLNGVFGWKPFVRDLQQMYNLWKNLDKRIAQLVRENGKGIRRRATLDQQNDSSSTTAFSSTPYSGLWGAPSSIHFRAPGAQGTLTTVQTQTTSKVWYVGKYQYYVPDIGSSEWTRRAKLALFGALPTPELLWAVMPWSWLVDWFTNASDVFANVSPNAVDNLTSQYSYTMKHTKIVKTYSVYVYHQKLEGSFWGFGSQDRTFRTVDETEVKARVGGGNPFGLNVLPTSLSAGQWGILAALGLSRSSVK